MIELERLLALALGELDEDAASAVDQHVLACGSCADTLERLLRLGGAVRDVIRSGQVAFAVGPAMAAELRAHGLISRHYEVAPDQVVPCAVGAEDIYALTTLKADLRGVSQLDIIRTSPLGTTRLRDVPFDVGHGRVSYLSRSDLLRQLPDGRVTIQLLSVDPAGERKLGEYFLQHKGFASPGGAG